MDFRQINSLLDKLASGSNDTAEAQQAKIFIHRYKADEGTGLSDEELFDAQDEMWDAIQKAKVAKVKTMSFRKPLIAAAAIILFIGAGLIYQRFLLQVPIALQDNVGAVQDVAPGKNGATLTLQDGKKIYIPDDSSKGTLAELDGVTITKSKDGQLVYQLNGSSTAVSGFNTLQTSNSQQIQVILPDGSRVFLNAASSLTYPSSFIGASERALTLAGEAYFEVARDKSKPFVVRTKQQTVTVLGTHFNIKAYADEPNVHTTLVEGSVQVATDKQLIKLFPGEQAVSSKNGQLNKYTVNVDNEIGWHSGYFVFDDIRLEELIAQVARWYDVRIIFDSAELKDELFSGAVSRQDSLSTVLAKLKLASKVNFILNNKTVHIQKLTN